MSIYQEPYSDEQIKDAVSKQITAYNNGYGLFAVLKKSNGSLIGDCWITTQNIDGAKEFEIEYHIKKPFWGYGYAAEAGRAFKQYGFEELKIGRSAATWIAHTSSHAGLPRKLV